MKKILNTLFVGDTATSRSSTRLVSKTSFSGAVSGVAAGCSTLDSTRKSGFRILRRIASLTCGSVAFVLMFVLAGCVAPELQLRIDNNAPEIKIAALLPLSGKNRHYATQMLEGISFGVHELNSNRGINGKTVDLIVQDTGGTPSGAVRAIKTAAALGAVAVVAGYDSSEVAALVDHASRLRLPMIVPLATDDETTANKPFVFRNAYTNSQQAEVLTGYLWYWRKLLRIGVLIDSTPENITYARSIGRDSAQYFTDLGGEVVKNTILPETGDCTVALRDLLACNPQAIIITSEAKKSAQLIKQIRQLGYIGTLCGPDTWDSYDFFTELQGINPGDCLYTAFFSDESQSDVYLKFKKDFRARYLHNPGSCETQSYDAIKLLAAGLWNANNLPEFERNYLAIKKYRGAAAIYTMLKGGDIDRTIYINSIGINHDGMPYRPFGRLLHQMQYSKLETYRSEQ